MPNIQQFAYNIYNIHLYLLNDGYNNIIITHLIK